MFDEKKNKIEQFVKQHLAIINKAAFFYSNNVEEREDLVQEIIYQVCRVYSDFRGEAKSTTWVYRIAINTCISYFRKNKVQWLPLNNEYNEIEDQDNEIPNEQIINLKQSIEKLNEGDKPVVLLYLEDLSYKEIADILGITENAVAIKMHRIKTKLKKIMI